MHLWRSEYAAFIRLAQAKFCRRLYLVPLSTFHRLSQLIGDPGSGLIFMFNTARCGSTLLVQVSCCVLWTVHTTSLCQLLGLGLGLGLLA